jgi:DNA-binding MarR family transcriptional regulator
MANDLYLEEVYAFICQHWQDYGYGPTLKEIATACYMSKPNVYRYLDRLEMEGRITRDPGRARSISLTKPCPHDPKNT